MRRLKVFVFVVYLLLLVLKLIDVSLTFYAINYRNAIELNPFGFNVISIVWNAILMIVWGFIIFIIKDKLVLNWILLLLIGSVGFYIFVNTHNYLQLVTLG